MVGLFVILLLHTCHGRFNYVQLPTLVVTESQVTDYLYQTGMPAMSEFTTCFWFDGPGSQKVADLCTIISLATIHNYNEMLIGVEYRKLVVRVGVSMLRAEDIDADQIFAAKHKHCITWNSTSIQWYVDLAVPGRLDLVFHNDFNNAGVADGGTMVLLQEQDAFQGSFDVTQVAQGHLAWFNIWDYTMTQEELNLLKYTDEGNIVNWGTLQHFGFLTFREEYYPYPDHVNLIKWYDTNDQAAVMCEVTGARLDNHETLTSTESTDKRCLMECLTEMNCYSANYRYSTKQCQLNNDTDTWNESDFFENLGSDYIHFTIRQC